MYLDISLKNSVPPSLCLKQTGELPPVIPLSSQYTRQLVPSSTSLSKNLRVSVNSVFKSSSTCLPKKTSVSPCLRVYPTTAPFITSTINLTSSSVTIGPLGKQSPLLNKASLTPFTYAGLFL